MLNKRKLIFVAAVLLVGALLFTFTRGKPKTSANKQPPEDPNVAEVSVEAQRNAGFEIASVEERPLRRVVRATGIVAPDQVRVGHVFPLARGIVEKVYVRLGDKVRQGQPMVTYDNIELGQMIGEYLRARGELERLQAQEQVASKNLNRARALIEVQAIAQQEFDLRQAEQLQAAAAVESQRAEIARIEEQIHRFGLTDADLAAIDPAKHKTHRTASSNVLVAPISGVITKFDVSSGEVVDPGKELFTVADTSIVWVLADLYEKDLGQVRSGGTAQITVPSYPGAVFSGRIDYVSDFLDPASRTAKVRCVVQNRDSRLKLDMFATVEIPIAEASTALGLPSEALQQIAMDTVVFVPRDATHFEKRVVQVGQRGQAWVEVLAGVGKGEQVVSKGSFYLKSALLREQIGGEK